MQITINKNNTSPWKIVFVVLSISISPNTVAKERPMKIPVTTAEIICNIINGMQTQDFCILYVIYFQFLLTNVKYNKTFCIKRQIEQQIYMNSTRDSVVFFRIFYTELSIIMILNSLLRLKSLLYNIYSAMTKRSEE